MIKILLKHDTHNRWKTTSFIPRKDELIHIVDKNRLAIGDGVTPYKYLKKYTIPKGLEQLALYYSKEDKPAIVIDLKEDSEIE